MAAKERNLEKGGRRLQSGRGERCERESCREQVEVFGGEIRW